MFIKSAIQSHVFGMLQDIAAGMQDITVFMPDSLSYLGGIHHRWMWTRESHKSSHRLNVNLPITNLNLKVQPYPHRANAPTMSEFYAPEKFALPCQDRRVSHPLQHDMGNETPCKSRHALILKSSPCADFFGLKDMHSDPSSIPAYQYEELENPVLAIHWQGLLFPILNGCYYIFALKNMFNLKWCFGNAQDVFAGMQHIFCQGNSRCLQHKFGYIFTL